jgi:hypothetical protein
VPRRRGLRPRLLATVLRSNATLAFAAERQVVSRTGDVVEIPDGSNFFASLAASTTVEAVAGLYRSAGWHLRRCGWNEFEVTSPIAELVIEGDLVLVHGPVADPVANAEAVTRPLRDGAVRFNYECYGQDQSLLVESRGDPDVQR